MDNSKTTLPKWFIDEGHKVYKNAEVRTNQFSNKSLKLTPNELTMYEFIKAHMDFDQLIETSADMLRYNNDNTQTFVKFTGDTPSFLAGKTQYTQSEIKAIIDDVDGEWYIDPTE